MSVERRRNREAISVATEQFKGVLEAKQSPIAWGKLLSVSPHLDSENINCPRGMVTSSIETCAIYLCLLACALERMRPVSPESLHSLNVVR